MKGSFGLLARYVCETGVDDFASAYVWLESSLTTRTKCEQFRVAAKRWQQRTPVDQADGAGDSGAGPGYKSRIENETDQIGAELEPWQDQ
ncbi:MAG TPA: hypothetical protein P5341_14905 [Hyphomonas sp.]|nr:hypothetical protein [Hyphomonas sp.]